ncbi:MAG: hypothetical protein ED859_13725 [Desulfuromonadales bacterium]|nr:MAG: hypothetical protein ED859_13725 [Desulfuromonadales bacterium]
MKGATLLIASLVVYGLLIVPFSEQMRTKPFVEKLGYIPQGEVLRMFSGDQKQSMASGLMTRILIYFGTLVEKSESKIDVPPDYFAIYKMIDGVTKLDPYNMDAYYFAQAVLVWDVKRIKEVNALLDYGMKYRDWDFYLPFFAGFNNAYFLKDYEKAARYYKRAGDITGDELHVNLAGRYFYETGQTDLAIAYLNTMIRSAKSDAIRKSFQTRLQALKEVKRVEQALVRYRTGHGGRVPSLAELVDKGYLDPPPLDPYGGSFYLDETGMVRTTSKFARRTGD